MINLTIVRITLRGLLGRRRFLLLLPLPALVVGLALLAGEVIGADPGDWVQAIVIGLGIAVVLPIMSLVIGASVLGAEIDDGTVVHILAKPLPRREIVIAKLLVAVLVTVAALGPAMLLAGLVAGSGRLGLGLLAGTVAGALAYTALFLALSLLTRRPVLFGLIYVLVWEGLLTNVLAGARVLSIQQYAITVADRVADSAWFAASVSLPVALIMTAVVTVGATVLAVDRLRSFTGLATRT